MFVSFDSNSATFKITFNGEVLDDYKIVNRDPNMVLSQAIINGPLSVNYLGFTSSGKLKILYLGNMSSSL